MDSHLHIDGKHRLAGRVPRSFHVETKLTLSVNLL